MTEDEIEVRSLTGPALEAALTLQRARTEAIRCAKRAARSSNLRRRVRPSRKHWTQ